MIGTVLDYSAGFPGGANIKRAGHLGVVRYGGYPDRPKCITRSELADLDDHGLGVAIVHENKADDWRGGLRAGRDGAKRTRDHCNSIGLPVDLPVYMAIDQDVVRSGEFGIMIDYLWGAAGSLGGPSKVGVYGEADVIDRARGAGVATYFWQTAAWSKGRRALNIDLFQKVGAVTVGGVECDVSEVLSPDWGQHNVEDRSMTEAEMIAALDKWAKGHAGADGRNLIDTWLQTGIWAGAGSDDEQKIIDTLTGALAEGNGKILAALADLASTQSPVSDAQLGHLATVLREGLGQDIVTDLGHRLIAPVTT
jgi:Domain of unknown function (DUF1906)